MAAATETVIRSYVRRTPLLHADLGDFGDGFFFESAGGAAAVERVIVGIDEHGERVG